MLSTPAYFCRPRTPGNRPRLDPANADGDAVVALEALLRWARSSGRPFDAVLPLVNGRFAPADIVAFMDRTRPGAASLREVFDGL
ncbi:hypothetical protein OPU71_16845 [Niveibacterium sp. 24ML]|uniref:hypothetical protein n=1 Tax=Niveibacterium sp. 24ML TaxID=2985512 RepID=UPI00226FA45E|nr:hypothetical protein [Niveibacterium sp. 24ML]MCX9157793.1 hypothetical protein [Niveibacterium sp. 24ML]